MQKLRVLVSSRSPSGALIVQALRESSSFEVFEAPASTFAEKIPKLQPDVLLLEEAEGEDPLPLIGEIRRLFPFIIPILLARDLRGRDSCTLYRTGVAACLPLRWPPRRILQAVEFVGSTGAFCAPSAGRRPFGGDAPAADLSAREKEILTLLAKNLGTGEIARKLYLAESTVRTYLQRLFRKLGVRSRAEAVVWAIQEGLVSGVSLAAGRNPRK
ncbi:MAG: response regulator transcription factor [Bacillota bacterium]